MTFRHTLYDLEAAALQMQESTYVQDFMAEKLLTVPTAAAATEFFEQLFVASDRLYRREKKIFCRLRACIQPMTTMDWIHARIVHFKDLLLATRQREQCIFSFSHCALINIFKVME